jgi:hypothetical protein
VVQAAPVEHLSGGDVVHIHHRFITFEEIPLTTKTFALSYTLAAIALMLTACGGGGSSGGGSSTATGSQTGILTDAAVQGVSYRTSSGVTGLTGPNGQYSFNPGDSVLFTLGGITLGDVRATGIISPIQLAGRDDNRLQNLLVLFQSLDTDGNPSNGITIPAASAAAATNTVNLSQPPATFASSANTPLVTVMAAGGINRPVTTQASATAHFKEQGLALLSANVLVLYDQTTASMVRILPNGSYLHGQATPDSNCGGSTGVCINALIGTAGSELGTVAVAGFSLTGFQLTSTIVPGSDNNLSWGFSGLANGLSACDRQGFLPNGEGFLINVDGLCVAEPRGELLAKAPNVNTSIVGVWAMNTATSANTQHFVFLPNGKYLMVDPIGDTVNRCGGAGVEFGSYSWNSTTGQLTISNVTYDTNGCAGLFALVGGVRRVDTQGNPISTGTATGSFSGRITLGSNGQTATLLETPQSQPDTLYRVSK